MWDVWFGRDTNYSKTQSTPNDSYNSIDCDFRFFFPHSFVIFCLPYLFSFVRCSIRERWRGSLFQLPFVGISWIYLCLRSSDPSLCFFQIMGSIDCTWMWYGWLFVHWTSGMEKKQTTIIWMRKKKEKKIRKIRKKMSLSYQSQSYLPVILAVKKMKHKT